MAGGVGLLYPPLYPHLFKQPVLTEKENLYKHHTEIKQDLSFYGDSGLFSFLGKEKNLKQEKPKDETIICRGPDSDGLYVHLSEEAAGRIAWALTGVIGFLSLPFILLAVMM